MSFSKHPYRVKIVRNFVCSVDVQTESMACDVRVCLHAFSLHDAILSNGGCGQNVADANLVNKTFYMITLKCALTIRLH